MRNYSRLQDIPFCVQLFVFFFVFFNSLFGIFIRSALCPQDARADLPTRDWARQLVCACDSTVSTVLRHTCLPTRTGLDLEHRRHEAVQVRVADVAHRVVRRSRALGGELEREEPAVRALAPLQIHVRPVRDETLRDRVRRRWRDVLAESARGAHSSACKLDSVCALARVWVVAAERLAPSVTSDCTIDALRCVIGERNIRYPVGVAVAAEHNRVVDLMLRDVVEDAVAVGAVPVPGVEVDWRRRMSCEWSRRDVLTHRILRNRSG
jgi:hypothetical protein